MKGQKMLQRGLSLMLIGMLLTGCVDATIKGRFRVTLTKFVVHQATVEGLIPPDGRGDEVFALVNFAEFGIDSLGRRGILFFGAPRSRQSATYGDTDGRSAPVRPIGIDLRHERRTIRAGSASPTTGGLLTGDQFPFPGEHPTDPPTLDRIPMILWEGELRQDGTFRNAVVILPTIWEQDNIADIFDIWNQQASAWIRSFVSNSALFIINPARRPLIEQVDTVLSTIPQRNDFDRPIGIDGDAFNPFAADPEPATFIPAVMLLTFNSAQAASATINSSTHERGVVEIKYQDGKRYGPGNYSIFLLVERLPDR